MPRHLFSIVGPVVVIGLCAGLAARGVGNLAVTRVGGAVELGAAPTTVQSPAPERDLDGIIWRNLFCSTCAPARGPADPPVIGAGQLPLRLDNLRLVATLVSEEDPAWSFAAIRNVMHEGDGEFGLYGVGSRLPGGARVSAVEPRRVAVEQGGAEGYIELQPVTPSPTAPGAAPRAAEPLADLAAGIRKLGPRRFVVDRGVVRRVLANTPQLARWARIVPRTDRNGKPAGFALHRIRPGSIYALLGLRNGDGIRAVNGRPLTPEVALTLYSQLHSASHLTVSFDRRGKTVTHDYTIQ